ncbi:MAG: ABC transporter ATP-binding protein [Deltaproteobacteria bacterium]|jgi:NitT/TauT family transport system ATP-binding protein|nr:ABC transporter ATP-binding protein [Deltaproteobacteria bacterium]
MSQTLWPKGCLEAVDLHKTYRLESGATRQVIGGFNLTLTPKALTALMGPSGCGKSVLINLLAGYEEPDQGAIYLDNQLISGPGPDRLVVFQETALFPWLSVFENVAYGPKIQGLYKGAELTKVVRDLLRLVGLDEFRDQYPAQLSGGMQRRAELARALINHPKVALMDEPFRGLDALTRSLMRDYYLELFEKSQGCHLFVTAELDEALLLADSLVITTNQPAKVKKIIPVNLPRPRLETIRNSPEYLALKAESLELLHEEALKSFKAGALDAVDFVGAYAAVN